MFVWLYNILGSMLAWFESITGTYALSLLFYALIFKVVFIPFSIKQQKNQIKMAKLAPKIDLIKAKYKGRTDRVTMQKQQTEIMELQQKEGYSPFSGCLPLLIQFPLILLLYAVIQNPLSYIASYDMDTVSAVVQNSELSEQDQINEAITKIYNEITPLEEGGKPTEFKNIQQIQLINSIKSYISDGNGGTDAEKVKDIEKYGLEIESIPNFDLLGVNLAETPSIKNISILVLIPIIAAVASWFTMWFTRKYNGNPAMQAQDAQAQASLKIMDLAMPLMTLFIAFNFSGMLGLYWIFQSVLGLGQTMIIAKAMPMPKYTEEELKEMRRQQKAAEKAQRAAIKSQPKYKSLHYIDEDDYDTLPEIKSAEKNGNGISGSDMPEIKD